MGKHWPGWLERNGLRVLLAAWVCCAVAKAQAPVIINGSDSNETIIVRQGPPLSDFYLGEMSAFLPHGRGAATLGAPEERDNGPVPEFWLEPIRPVQQLVQQLVLVRPEFGDVIGIDLYADLEKNEPGPIEVMQITLPDLSVPATDPLEHHSPIIINLAMSAAHHDASVNPSSPVSLARAEIQITNQPAAIKTVSYTVEAFQTNMHRAPAQYRVVSTNVPAYQTWQTPTPPPLSNRPCTSCASTANQGRLVDVLMRPWRILPTLFRMSPD